MMHHFHRHPKTGRATELDPATFTPARFDPWRLIGFALCLASAVGVGFVIAQLF